MDSAIKAKALADIARVSAHRAAGGGSGAAAEIVTLVKACIERWAPPGTPYARAVESMVVQRVVSRDEGVARGALEALRLDIEADALDRLEQLVHAAVFDDLLAQADYFVSDGYTLPAAVVAGAALEEHLRQLAAKQGVALSRPGKRGSEPKKASELNDELHKAQAYTQVDWRRVQVWLDLRNEAAHGKPEFQQRTEQDIRPMIDGVRALIASFPA